MPFRCSAFRPRRLTMKSGRLGVSLRSLLTQIAVEVMVISLTSTRHLITCFQLTRSSGNRAFSTQTSRGLSLVIDQMKRHQSHLFPKKQVYSFIGVNGADVTLQGRSHTVDLRLSTTTPQKVEAQSARAVVNMRMPRRLTIVQPQATFVFVLCADHVFVVLSTQLRVQSRFLYTETQ